MLSPVFWKEAFVAQSVEQLTLNQLVDGSNPPEGTNNSAMNPQVLMALRVHSFSWSS